MLKYVTRKIRDRNIGLVLTPSKITVLLGECYVVVLNNVCTSCLFFSAVSVFFRTDISKLSVKLKTK